MKSQKQRPRRVDKSPNTPLLEQTVSVPAISKPAKGSPLSPKDGFSASESCIPKNTTCEGKVKNKSSPKEDKSSSNDCSGDIFQSPRMEERRCLKVHQQSLTDEVKAWRQERSGRPQSYKRSRSSCRSESAYLDEDVMTRQVREIHSDARKSSRIIRDSRARLLEIQKKSNFTEADIKELGDRNELLLREMERFDKMTRMVQRLVGAESATKTNRGSDERQQYLPGSVYEPPMYHELKMNHPSFLLGKPGYFTSSEPPTRSLSEVDLTRKLTESYDMQEKLVADNADLEVKRYILYKELMTKDQNLETCRAQVKRLQGELKLMNKENALLNEKLSKNNPEGDATAMNQNIVNNTNTDDTIQLEKSVDESEARELIQKLEYYKSSTIELEKTLENLELEVRNIRTEMDHVKGSACRAGRANSIVPCKGGAGRRSTPCFHQPPDGPPVPPRSNACGACPPCPASCNPCAPPTPAEKEVTKLKIQLCQTEENFKTKVTECAMLRADLLKRKEELEKERCLHREALHKLRDLEMRFQGLTNHTNMMLGTKEQAMENEINVRALKQCYREAREEIDELRTVMKELNEQLQDYRVKYLQAQQLVEEQRRQMDLMDMDNTRISEQINLEIQKVKLKFQEKLQELAPIPDLLKATQIRLKDAQQGQAIAEHNAEQLARELNCAREKVHALLHNSIKPPEKGPEKGNDEKQLALLQQRITQLTESNQTLKAEIERQKANVIRMEEAVLANEKRLQEKMHECAQLGGELDRARDEAARALQRANERTETIRKCMQTTVAELERQLAASRAKVHVAEKEREEVQCRMQCQIKRLNENFEQAQYRIMGLTTQVQTLRRTVSSTGEGDVENQDCACKKFFENP